MVELTMQDLVLKQKNFFESGKTKSLEFRLDQLNKLKEILYKYEQRIGEALLADLHKSQAESFLEFFICMLELKEVIKNLKSWLRPIRLPSKLALFPAQTYITYEPYGRILMISPWNYPIILAIVPIVGAIAAGNCVVLKPSELAPKSAELIKEMLSEFNEEYIAVVNGGPEVSEELLKEKFDSIFFTGGTSIGKIVMKAACEHLTPVTLELGGKSPCIVDETADLDLAARRIVWGKFTNAGQTCIAPDFLYVQRSVKYALIQKIIDTIKAFYSQDPGSSESYSHIINSKHYERILKLIDTDKVIYGGQSDPESRYIAPTLMDRVSWDDPVMKEEIFGPLLPILTFDELYEVVKSLKEQPHPLSLYLFTKSKDAEQLVLKQLQFGNGCVNDCFMQFNSYMPFGGVGLSGMGQYKGKWSIETFSQKRPLLKRSGVFDWFFFYPNAKNPKKTTRMIKITRWLLGI